MAIAAAVVVVVDVVDVACLGPFETLAALAMWEISAVNSWLEQPELVAAAAGLRRRRRLVEIAVVAVVAAGERPLRRLRVVRTGGASWRELNGATCSSGPAGDDAAVAVAELLQQLLSCFADAACFVDRPLRQLQTSCRCDVLSPRQRRRRRRRRRNRRRQRRPDPSRPSRPNRPYSCCPRM